MRIRCGAGLIRFGENAPNNHSHGVKFLMSKIRVLVVDDSVVVRRIVSDVLTADPALEVVGTAAHGKIALAKIPQVNPDVITLDIEMPEMDGLETLKAIRKTHPRLPVIMFSTLTLRGGATTLEALALGASDYVTKPANVGSVSASQQSLRDQLIPKIKGLCGKADSVKTAIGTPVDRPSPVSRSPSSSSTPIAVVAIGVSTGGPNALSELLPAIPASFPVPIVIVQHMPPMFTKLLADRLNSQCKIPVQEGADGAPVLPGQVQVAPGDYHMVVKRQATRVVLGVNQDPAENASRPAVDVLFRSVVDVYGAGTLGVILTGMGQDGLRGCERIREIGGQVFTQDEASSVVWGMPGCVTRAGLANQVLPLNQLAAEIVKRVQSRRNANEVQKVGAFAGR